MVTVAWLLVGLVVTIRMSLLRTVIIYDESHLP